LAGDRLIWRDRAFQLAGVFRRRCPGRVAWRSGWGLFAGRRSAGVGRGGWGALRCRRWQLRGRATRDIRCSYFSSRPSPRSSGIWRAWGLLGDGHDRDEPLRAGGQAPIRSRGQRGWRDPERPADRIEASMGAAADLRARPLRKLWLQPRRAGGW